MDVAAHDDDLADPEERLGVRGRGQGHVGEGPDGEDGDRVRRVLPEDAQDLLVGGRLGRGEVLGVHAGVDGGVRVVVEQVLPRVRGGEMGMGLMDAVQPVYAV